MTALTSPFEEHRQDDDVERRGLEPSPELIWM